MTHLDPIRPIRVVRRVRKTSPLALIVFAIAYLGVLVITFAPQASLRAQPAVQQMR